MNPCDGHPVSVMTVVLPPAASDTILAQLATKGPDFSAGVFPSKKAWQLMAQKSEAWQSSGLSFIATIVSTVTIGPL